MVMNRETFEGFDYVVNVKASDKICFGSTIERNTSPVGKGLSPYQKLQVSEIFPRIGPGYYDSAKITSAFHHQLNKVRSKAGVGPLASKDPRFRQRIYHRTPSPGRYDVRIKRKIKRSAVPFGTTSHRKQFICDNDNPGPPTYNLQGFSEYARTKSTNSFGKPKIYNAVETICVNNPTDTCHKCIKLCEGDYWHKDYALFLCQLCWNEEKTTREIYDETTLKQFKKIRNCSFMHDHQNTNAAVRIVPGKKVTKKIRIENYLDVYFVH
nr:uncharacterized protein LOC111514718 [Leptinotarsa decemlineata]